MSTIWRDIGLCAQGHLDTQLGGAGDRTSNLAVPSQLAEPHPARGKVLPC